jgi:hypothetical protein
MNIRSAAREEPMAKGDIIGSVAGLWRFPVKSMRGERLEQVEITPRGLVGDRAYALGSWAKVVRLM